jgi:hypothetical protein
MKRGVKRLLVALALFLTLGVVDLLSGFGDAVSNSLNLWRLERSFASIRHPPATESIRFEARVGLLSGNGNHCDYFVGELRAFQGSFSPLLAAYAGATVFDPKAGHPMPLEVSEVNGDEISAAAVPIDLDRVSAWTWGSRPPSGSRLYLVSYFANYEANGDWRCH